MRGEESEEFERVSDVNEWRSILAVRPAVERLTSHKRDDGGGREGDRSDGRSKADERSASHQSRQYPIRCRVSAELAMGME